MTAVVRPVSVNHPHFRESRVALFGSEIVAAEAHVVRVHRKPVLLHEFRKPVFAHRDEPVQHLDVGGSGIFRFQGRGKLFGRFPALDGVDDEFLYLVDIPAFQVAVKHIELCRADDGLFALRHQLYALRCGVRPLVELTGERLNPEHRARTLTVERRAHVVELGLREYVALCVFEQLAVRAFHVVTVDDAHFFEPFHAQHSDRFRIQRARFCKRRLLFHENSVDHISSVKGGAERCALRAAVIFFPSPPPAHARLCHGGNMRWQNALFSLLRKPCPRRLAACPPPR